MTAAGLTRPRILPVLIVAGLCLFGLKILGLATRGGYLIMPTLPGATLRALPPPAGAVPLSPDAGDITGSVPPKADAAGKSDTKSDGKEGSKGDSKGDAKSAKPDGKETKAGAEDAAKADPARAVPARPTAAEIEVLEKLAERRRRLEARTKELELREAMLKTAEKTLDDKAAGLRQSVAGQAPAEREAEAASAQMKALVIMYEAMKPRDAARVFEKMDGGALIQLTRRMNPRKLAEVVAQMSPDAAEKLTTGLMRLDAPPAAPAAPVAGPAPRETIPELPRLKPATAPKS